MSRINLYWIKIPKSISLSTLIPYFDILDEKEIQTFHKYKVDSKKLEFLLGRLLLKNILGQTLGLDPHGISFNIQKYGKPILENMSKSIHFNLSHSNRLIVAGFNLNGEIGVDVEYMDPEHLHVMNQVFSKCEEEHVNNARTSFEKLKAFYKIWTRKEALLKAQGTGIINSISDINVPLQDNLIDMNDWEFSTFSPCSDFLISSVIPKPMSNSSYHIEEQSIFDLLSSSCSTGSSIIIN